MLARAWLWAIPFYRWPNLTCFSIKKHFDLYRMFQINRPLFDYVCLFRITHNPKNVDPNFGSHAPPPLIKTGIINKTDAKSSFQYKINCKIVFQVSWIPWNWEWIKWRSSNSYFNNITSNILWIKHNIELKDIYQDTIFYMRKNIPVPPQNNRCTNMQIFLFRCTK